MSAKQDQPMLYRWPSTIGNVVRVAGVSAGTLSKALNEREQLREQTRRLVQSAAQRLNFRPDTLVPDLLHECSLTVGLISTDSRGRFHLPLLQGIEHAPEAARILLVPCTAQSSMRFASAA